MASNVQTVKTSHQNFNQRNFDAVVGAFDPQSVYRDHARGVNFSGHDELKTFLQRWVDAMSDAQITEPTYSEAGNVVIAQFTGRGRNDGPLGPLPPSGKEITLPFCEVIRFNEQGKISSVDAYYDQLTMLVQLGHAQPTVA
ncbi:MAG: ester cyclase [Acidobacteriota bacterium]